MRKTKSLIWLCGCADWFESSLGTHVAAHAKNLIAYKSVIFLVYKIRQNIDTKVTSNFVKEITQLLNLIY